MGLIEINVIGAQPAQAVFRSLQNMLTRKALIVGSVPDPKAALGGDDEALALALQPLAQNFFGAAGRLRRRRHGVGIRGIEKIDAGCRGFFENGERSSLIALVAER